MKINFFALPLLAVISTATDLKNLPASHGLQLAQIDSDDLASSYLSWDQNYSPLNLAETDQMIPTETNPVIAHYEELIKRTERSIQSYEASIAAFKANNKSGTANYDNYISTFERRIAKSHKRLVDYQAKIDAIDPPSDTTVINDIQKVDDEQDKNNEEDEKALAELQKELERLQKLIQEQGGTNSELSAQVAEAKRQYETMQHSIESQSKNHAKLMSDMQKLQDDKLIGKDEHRTEQNRKLREEAKHLATANSAKDTQARIEEEAEDARELKRSRDAKKRHDDLDGRIAAKKITDEEYRHKKAQIHDKELKAEKDGRSADAQRYRDDAAALKEKHRKADAEAQAIEHAEDAAEAKRARDAEISYSNLQSEQTSASRTRTQAKESLVKKCTADAQEALHYKKLVEDLHESAGVEQSRANEQLHNAELIKMEYENLQQQVDANKKDAAAANKEAGEDQRKAAKFQHAAELSAQKAEFNRQRAIKLNSDAEHIRGQTGRMLQNKAANGQELTHTTKQQKKDIADMRNANKSGMDAMKVSLAALPLSALVGLASLYKEHSQEQVSL